MRVGSLFAGIGGFDLGLERAGFDIAWQVEIDPVCQRIIASRFPHATRWADVREWTGDGQEPIDLLCGGFPCQDLSVAGKRAGLAGERSSLFYEIVRIATVLKPTWGFFENVPGLFSSHAGRDMAAVLEGLRQCWPVVGYAVLDSQHFGVPQRRRRVFFVCGPSEDRLAEILFESEGGCGDFATGGEAGAHLAASLRSRSSRPGVNPPGRGGEDDMNIVMAFQPQASCIPFHPVQITSKHNRSNPRPGDPCPTLPADPKAPMVAHASTANGFDASEDGTGRGTPIVPIGEVGCRTNGDGYRDGDMIGQEGDPRFTLQASKQHAVGVRRLTPTECERLQGFPDGWTCLCQPIDTYDAHRCTCPDGPRYKALGNAVTVNVVEWIGQRIWHNRRR